MVNEVTTKNNRAPDLITGAQVDYNVVCFCLIGRRQATVVFHILCIAKHTTVNPFQAAKIKRISFYSLYFFYLKYRIRVYVYNGVREK